MSRDALRLASASPDTLLVVSDFLRLRYLEPAMESSELLTTNRKALTINLDQAKYGTFAEIGAGQEVARHFFQAGGAAGTGALADGF